METAIPMLADQATTVVGRGINLWIAVQSPYQLEAVYGRARSHILRDNMETQIYYRPADLDTAHFLEHSLGRFQSTPTHTPGGSIRNSPNGSAPYKSKRQL